MPPSSPRPSAPTGVRRRRPRRVQRARHDRPGRRGTLTLERPTASPTGPCAQPAPCTGTFSPCTPASWTACRSRRPGVTSMGIDCWAWTTACWTRTARCSATRCTTATPAPRASRTRCGRPCPAAELYAATGLQYAPFNTLYQLTAAQGTAQLAAARTPVADPGPAHVLADRRAGHRADQRLHHPAARPAHPRPGRTTSPTRLGIDLAVRPPAAPGRPGRPRCCPHVLEETGLDRPGAGHDGRLARHRVRGGRGPRRRRDNFAYICTGTWSLAGLELDTPCSRRRAARPTSPTSWAWTAPSATSATSWACGCSRSACAPGAAPRPRTAAAPGAPKSPPCGRWWTRATPPSCAPGGMPHASPRPAGHRAAGARAPRPRRPAASSTPWRSPTAGPSTDAQRLRAGPWTSCTSSAAAPATRCCAN